MSNRKNAVCVGAALVILSVLLASGAPAQDYRNSTEHFEALNRLGPCVHHRRKFAPVAALLGVDRAEVDETAELSFQIMI